MIWIEKQGCGGSPEQAGIFTGSCGKFVIATNSSQREKTGRGEKI